MSVIKVALVGQPNVGKSALINSVGNARLRVGNFSGVTVKKEVVRFTRDDYDFEITDLPGSYSLTDYTIEERVTKHYLDDNDYDLILNVVDSTNIERNLYLTTELLSLNKKVVVALNMTDEAVKEGVHIDENQLGKILGVSCVKTSAVEKTGIDELIQTLIKTYNLRENRFHLQFSEVYEQEICHIVSFLEEKKVQCKISLKALAIKLLREDKDTYLRFHEEPVWIELQTIVNEAYKHLYLHYDTKDLDDIFNDEKLALTKGAVIETVQFDKQEKQTFTDKIDSLLMHQFVGLPIFLFMMWGLFQLTFEVGSIPMDWIDAFFALLIDATKSFLGDTELASVIADGAIAGVGAVVLFLPNIIILFLGIALLETTGYMSRVAFLLDGFFHKFGLHGKSFIPLVSGFGCSVPAYMAARTLKNDRDRLLTLFIIGFMSCGARLPIYVLFVGAFFAEHHAGNLLFLIYITGALLGIIAAKVLKMTAFKGDDEPFVMEMPKYRLPSFKLIWHTVSGQAMMYLKKAGTFILLASVLVWFASNYPKLPEIEQQYQVKIEQADNERAISALNNELAQYKLEHSYLGIIGHASEPFFAPLGYDWRMAIALETGLAAKEVVVATLGVLYGLGEEQDEESSGLIEKIRANISLPAGISFIVFVMIYLPCLAASMVFMREAGSWKYLAYLFVFTTATAWSLSFIAFNTAQLFT
ncbi:MAG: ferrous iron transport protein B [gamma proteobacterium symbiont of Bathyaustriella thionipta]|nr:ferrous iron transport protein B [gamma proteobacterium symbiont of Bathyaustriella thionipta]MCU7950301.1 ferrous iron transport protein B [gamma proteobacterium symbiont of Bathyaustriella thionipta]MCU7953188.1 ferrous iron transport protein B [gamma proteobacterium symbiont of Bathyaustriella thionipta]MCU7957158.1 ferrous iron transport protein B [gamma proteobacterium symbiont of Bathyaustriella thionipta]MCU7968016.1 ferrous iron transport protein B [gamma proteobacterium symbiont of 